MRDTGLLMLGLSLVVANRLGQLIWPLAAAGQLALTLYVAHVLVFHWFGSTLRSQQVTEGLATVAAVLAAAVVIAAVWRSLSPRGPLEFLMVLPMMLARRR